MGCNAIFGVIVHGLGANLNLDRSTIGVPHHRVQGLVAVGFGLGDVIVKLLWDGRELLMHPAEHLVTIRHLGDHHAQCTNVKNPVKSQ